MKNTSVLALILSSIFLLTPLVYCQQLTDWEKEAYYDLMEEYYYMPEGTKSDVILQKVASKYSISVEELEDIENEACLNQEPTEREYEIFNAIFDKLEAMPKGYTREDEDRVYSEKASKYGISPVEAYEIYWRILMCW